LTPDFRSFYAQVGHSDKNIATRAARVIMGRVRNHPLGSHDGEAADYLATLQHPAHWDYLSQVVGRYGFDPTPILRDALISDSDNQPFIVAVAACHSDPNWAATLGLFIRDQMLPLLSHLDRQRQTLTMGTAALLNLGRTDLAMVLRARVDWPKVMEFWGGRITPTPTISRLQSKLMGQLSAPALCQ
jgi:hypothetical protein